MSDNSKPSKPTVYGCKLCSHSCTKEGCEHHDCSITGCDRGGKCGDHPDNDHECKYHSCVYHDCGVSIEDSNTQNAPGPAAHLTDALTSETSKADDDLGDNQSFRTA